MKIIDGDSLLTNYSARVHLGTRKYFVLCNRSGTSRSCSVLLLLLGVLLILVTPLFWYPWHPALVPGYPGAAATYPCRAGCDYWLPLCIPTPPVDILA